MQRSVLVGLVFAGVSFVGCSDLVAPVDSEGPAPQASAESATSLSLGDLPSTDRHLVVFKKDMPDDFAERVAALGGEIHMIFPRGGAASVSGLGAEGAAALLASKDISVVEEEVVLEMPSSVTQPEVFAVHALSPSSADNPSSAFFFARQWNMRAIGADAAWAAGHLGSPDVTVAILDTGIGYNHPDLQGLVDLDRSVSFVPADDQYVAAYFRGAHPVADIGYHGTHVAATVASNGLAAAGVTSKTTLMGVKVCSVATGGCPSSAIFAGIEHAIDNGADVINMSLGGAFQRKAAPGFVSVINSYFNEAHRAGVVVVVSAGNDAADLDHHYFPNANDVQTHYPSLYKTYCTTPHNICVSATGPTATAGINGPWAQLDAPASYTNFGRSAINVAAPGGNSGGSVSAACSPFSLVQPVCQTGAYVIGISGTSMASPHVAGLAALVIAKNGRGNVAQVRNAIEKAADDLGQRGTDPFYGKGRINIARTLGVN